MRMIFMAALVAASSSAACADTILTHRKGLTTLETDRGTYTTRTYRSGNQRIRETTFEKKTYFPMGREGYDPMQSRNPTTPKAETPSLRKIVEDRQRFLKRLEYETERATRCEPVTLRDDDGRIRQIFTADRCRNP